MNAAVVGAGYSGLLAAIALARAGARVTVFEEHKSIGKPQHCTGIVSPSVAAELESLTRRKLSIARYSEIAVAPGGEPALILATETVKVNRVALELGLADVAEREGVKIEVGTPVKKVSPDGWVTHTGGGGRYDIVIVADGAYGRISAMLRDSEPLKAYGVNYVKKDYGEMHRIVVDPLDQRAYCFFSWRVPLRGGVTLEGYASTRRPLAPPPGDAKGAYGGVVLLGPPLPARRGRIVTWGDASALVKPLTGGGLAPQLEAYKLLARLLGEMRDPALAALKSQLIVASRLKPAARLSRLLYTKCLIRELFKSPPPYTLKVKLDFDDHLSPRSIAWSTVALLVLSLSSPIASAKLLPQGLAAVVERIYAFTKTE